jgi:putative ABC transport system ATP-binding protein
VPVPLFAFESVVVTRHGDRALDGVQAEVQEPGITVIQGPSGAGKSTLLRLCNRLEVPDAGCVRFRGDDVGGLDPLDLRRRVGFVFQRPTPFPGTVRENLRVGAPEADDDDLAPVLEQGALDSSFLARFADELSVGEAQRMCLARTLATGPEVLLLDEPTSALDPDATKVLERTVRELAEGGIPALWVTHDESQADRVGDRSIRLEGGRVVGQS